MNCDLTNFWPTASMSDLEKLQASTRFIIYATVLLYAYQRDPRIFTIALVSIFVLYFSYKRQQRATAVMPPASDEPQTTEKCRQATEENPAGNRLVGPGYLASAPTCDQPDYINSLINQRQIMQPQQALFGGTFEREFYTTPLAMDDWAAGQKKFAEYLGQPLSPSEPFCKDDQSKCVASWTGRPGGAGGSR
jgi:hypothetical protein